MKRLRGVAVCSVATFALIAALAASASATLPEFSEPFPKHFTLKSTTVTGQPAKTESHERVVCTASSVARGVMGEIIRPKNGSVTLRLTGCKGHTEAFGEELEFSCNTEGAGAEEIVTSPLAMTLGYINETKEEVGVALEPELERPGTRAPFTKFECDKGFAHFTWLGSVIGKLTPVNKKVKPRSHLTLTFTELKGKQKPSKLEGGPTDILTGRAEIGGELPKESPIGLSAKDAITFTEPVEVKA